MRIPVSAKILGLALAASSPPASAEPDPAPAKVQAPPDLAEGLKAARHGLTLSETGLSGDGADLIRSGIAEARYVAIGEDHFTREIPRLTSAICDAMGPQGLSAYVVETGPFGAARIAPMLGAADRRARMEAFVRAYPNAVAFADGEDENDAAAHCRNAGGRSFRFIGVDQEFFGAPAMLLDDILQSRLDRAARQSILALREEERRASAAAARTGDPSGLLMLSASPERLRSVEAALRRGGDARARALFAELRISRDIYALNHAGSPAANEMRARLMKRHLAEALPATGKVLLKFGDWHLYMGVNPLGQRDVGNFIAERAEGEGGQSLHILVLPVGGQHGQFGGYGRQAQPQAFTMSDDRDYRWFKLAADTRLAAGWTVFDLRSLRHRKFAGVDADWRRVIDGYDLMVVIPEASAAKLIGY